jgi:hypothetical protein
VRAAGIVGGVALALVGAVWVLQGLNAEFAPNSFMTGSRVWLIVGVVTFVGGMALVRLSLMRR